PFVDALGRDFFGRRLPLANVEVQPNALEELLLVGILPQHRLEERRRFIVRMTLQCRHASLVDGHSLEIRRAALWRGRRCRPRTQLSRTERRTCSVLAG